MLIECPECNLQVSDKALSCPHCGYPLKPEAAKPRKARSNKRKRLPNGFGQITELKGKALRKPFRAMVTTGKTKEGKPISRLLKPEAYFETYNDAYLALVNYNKNPYDFSNNITMQELYDRWSAEFYPKLASPGVYKASWKYCSLIYNMPVQDLRIKHVKKCMDEGEISDSRGTRLATPQMKSQIKTLIAKMLDYAVEYEIVDKNCARKFAYTDTPETQKQHIDYTDDEMQKLWENINATPYLDLILVQCYTGLRPQEIGNILREETNINERYFVGGMKTDSGKNRIVPIHSRVLPFFEKYYADSERRGSKYLFNVDIEGTRIRTTSQVLYRRYKSIVDNAVAELHLNPNHKPHDGRVHFVTQAKKAELDEYAIKRIVGHKITDITEAVYTKRDVAWLKSEIEKIP